MSGRREPLVEYKITIGEKIVSEKIICDLANSVTSLTLRKVNWWIDADWDGFKEESSTNTDSTLWTTCRGNLTCIDLVFARHVQKTDSKNYVFYFSSHKPVLTTTKWLKRECLLIDLRTLNAVRWAVESRK